MIPQKKNFVEQLKKAFFAKAKIGVMKKNIE